MVARVLIIDDNELNVSPIVSKLQKFYYSLSFAKSVEDSLRIVRSQSVDAVFLSLPPNLSEKSSKSFLDFCSVLKQLCGVIPVIGIAESEDRQIPLVKRLKLDDVVGLDVGQKTLIGRIRALTKMKNLFDDSLLNNMHLDECDSRKIVSFFHDNLDFLPESVLENTRLVASQIWPATGSFDDADLFLINVNHDQANECCAGLRLRKANRYKPIVFTFNDDSKDKIKRAAKLDVGFTDVVGSESNPAIIGYRLNSLIRYKKLYDAFSKKLERSLFLSAIDSTTEVYNRSFLDDYLKNNERVVSNTAVIMLDVDKFKSINDKFGHSFADSMLKHVSNMIKRHIRSSDVIARYGGDEFIVLMNDVSQSIAENIADRIREKIGGSPFGDAKCTVSIGMCCMEPRSSSSLREAISIADKFMYVAKQSGGNSVKICA